MKCRVCGKGRGHREYAVPEMMFGTGESFTYFSCSRCRCLQIKEIPPDFSKYYRSEYYSLSQDPSKEGRLRKLGRQVRTKSSLDPESLVGRILLERFPNYALESLSRIPLTRSTKILDVGCGTGTLIYSLRAGGFENVLGIDPYVNRDIRYDNGTEVRNVSIDKVDGVWDVVMFHHSFEHMTSPARALRSVSKLLSSQGICILTLTTVSSHAWREYGVHWVQLDAPRRICLHSMDSLRRIVDQVKLGIESVIIHSSDFQFWGSEQYRQGIPLFSDRSYAVNPSKSIFKKQDIRAFRKRAKELNEKREGDQFAVYLKKPS